MNDTMWTLLAAIVMVVGLFGVVIPVLPGLALIWVAALVYGLIVGFGSAGVAAMVVLSVLLAGSVVVGVLLPRKAMQDSGAATWSQWAAVVGAIIGFFVIPIVGVLVGALVGVWLAEWSDKGDPRAAWTSTLAVAKGFGINTLVQFGIGTMMIAVWSLWATTVVF